VKCSHSLEIVAVQAGPHIEVIRELFREYAASIGIDLCFQGFERELAELPGLYAAPGGALFLAREGSEAAGCVGVRRLADGICEMKRLYVRPPFRRTGLGRALASESCAAARRLRYGRMRLDTLESMGPAIALYESLGFRRIAPYYDNPNEGVVFLELDL
jgi:putative acetyltransferase